MNRARRKELRSIVEALGELRDRIEKACDEEQEYYDNMAEGLRDFSKGQAAETAIDEMSGATSEIDLAILALESAVEAK